MFDSNKKNKYRKIFVALVSVVAIICGHAMIIVAASPTVITNPATNITKTSANITGTIIDSGGEDIINTGFEFGTSVSYGQSITGEEEYQQTAEFGIFGSGNSEFIGPTGIDIDSVGNIYVLDQGNDRVSKYNSSHVWQSNIVSGDLPVDNGFVFPLDVTVLSDDSIAVFDMHSGPGNDGAIIFIDSSGNFADCYGLGASCSHIRNYGGGAVKALTSTSADDLYYTYATGGGHGVLGIDNTLANIYEISSFAPTDAEGGFDSPAGLYVDGPGSVYITETANNRLQKFSAGEAFIFQIGRSDEASGSGDGELNTPIDVALDGDGSIFIVDRGNNRVQKFDSAGGFISKFGTTGSGDNNLNNPGGIAVDASNDIYVTDTGNNRVVKYELGFAADLSVIIPGLVCGTTYHYRAFATNADGTSYGADEQFTTLPCEIPIAKTVGFSDVDMTVATLSGSHEDQGSIYTTERGFEYGTSTSYGSEVNEDGDLFISAFGGSGGGGGGGTFISLNSVGTDKDGNVFTTDIFEDVIQKFDSDGNHISDYSVSAPAPGGVTTPVVVRGAPDGKLYAVDSANSKIIRFDDSDFTNPVSFAAGVGLTSPNDIAFDSTGNVYIVDRANLRVIKVDSTGSTILLTVDEVGGGPFTDPTSVAVDSAGNIYVADTGAYKIIAYDSTGLELNQSGSNGTNDGQFGSGIPAISVDEYGYLLIADPSNNRIQKFDSNLTFQSKFGESGSGNGDFSTPSGLALGSNGDIFVADSGNNRVQKFNERFTLDVTGLACETLYHFRAYAESADGRGVGSDSSFTTSTCPPSTGGGGGISSGTHFICTDPTALNYTPPTENGKPKDAICRYPEKELSCIVPLYLTKAVRYGGENNPLDVKLLENFLNTYESQNLPVDGFYSAADRDVVIRWQEKYPSEILKPWGLSHGTGYVYLTSLRKIKQIHEAECARLGQSILGDHCYLYDRKLKRGDNNVFVKSAQKALRASGNLSGIADGVFGKKTEQAVRDFQAIKGLKIDGIIGQGTGHELGQVKCDL